jgi:putative tryptophan/tyrosine transport system substrate-binding protein
MLMGMITPRANRPWVEAITSLARMGLSPTTCAYAISKSSCKGSEFSVRLLILRVSNLNEVEEAFATRVAQQAGALLVSGDPTFFAWRERLATLAAHHAVPAIYLYREIVEAGGLMSYAMSIVEAYRTVGAYAARVLNGEKPADLPVQQSSKSEFVINLKAAKALGIEVPAGILVRADEVIE